MNLFFFFCNPKTWKSKTRVTHTHTTWRAVNTECALHEHSNWRNHRNPINQQMLSSQLKSTTWNKKKSQHIIVKARTDDIDWSKPAKIQSRQSASSIQPTYLSTYRSINQPSIDQPVNGSNNQATHEVTLSSLKQTTNESIAKWLLARSCLFCLTVAGCY